MIKYNFLGENVSKNELESLLCETTGEGRLRISFLKKFFENVFFFHFGLFHLYDFKVVLAVHGKTTQQSLRAIYS